jgi:hypothetical protein
MKLIQKILLVAAATMLSAPAYAMSDLPLFNYLIGIVIVVYLFPVVLGLLIAKKGRRSWFAGVSIIVCASSLLMLPHFPGFIPFVPLLSLPIAIYTHWQKVPSIEVTKDENSVKFY